MVAWIWLGLIIVCVVIEAASPQLVSIWFVLGFVGALIASFFGAEVWLQIVIAIAIALITLIATRPLVKKINEKKISHFNADKYIGKEGIVTSEINDTFGTGRVTVQGSSWSAISEGDTIKEGAKVIVEKIEGVKLLVKEI